MMIVCAYLKAVPEHPFQWEIVIPSLKELKEMISSHLETNLQDGTFPSIHTVLFMRVRSL